MTKKTQIAKTGIDEQIGCDTATSDQSTTDILAMSNDVQSVTDDSAKKYKPKRNKPKKDEHCDEDESEQLPCPPCPECEREVMECEFEWSRTQNTPAQVSPNNPNPAMTSGEKPNKDWENGLWYESTRATVRVKIDPTKCQCYEMPPCCTGQIAVEVAITFDAKEGPSGANAFSVVPDTVDEAGFTRRTGRNGLRLQPGAITSDEARNAVILTAPPNQANSASATLSFSVSCEDGEYLQRYTFLPKDVVEKLTAANNSDNKLGMVVPGAGMVNRPAFLDIRIKVENCGCKVSIPDIFLVNFATADDELAYFEALFQEQRVREALDSLPMIDVPGLPQRPRTLRNVFRLIKVKGTNVDTPFPPKGTPPTAPIPWDDFINQLEGLVD